MTTPEIIGPLPVVRAQDGYWCHPALEAFYHDREYVADREYQHWLSEKGLEDALVYQDDDNGSPAEPEWLRRADFALWSPPVPDGDGWFMGAVYVDENDGPCCIWFRCREASCSEQ